ncbi:hypothetical protein DJ83_03190 [Halorubrum ezzemoulense]|uniref:Transcriptional regulator HTH-type FeoC domain-containing protein n=1 Tax=Halorubrum ezzemoulense TaxID=337243 RepID=A0A256J334_HALEZ|nr:MULTISPECIES: FeoC-like transcriptional regulator [Halorubrum]OYR63234.1 hypothetical protein DJ83_03190 [Halorubrum ezzemoulense]OYR76250.1 hypothetical protein DJ84_22595 [Halorubrum ezzemoulense]PHQ41492.1 hypothetical protein Z052_14420 [Halorubrum sp. C191]QAY21488.1 hypothetical protein EO776_15920 [Halorubrum ezzemoulense]TKX42759.1 hypothetical protein EXE41_16660 [Halorubrum sp. SD690R]
MSTYRRVLAMVARNVPVSTIATRLDTREDAIRGMLDSMVREGYLRTIDCESAACSGCPMSDACGMGADGNPMSYLLTQRGRELLAEHDCIAVKS